MSSLRRSNSVLDFIFIGPDKSGSTWLYERLREHPSIALPPAKELFYFDRHYHLGNDWLRRQFAGAQAGQLRGEISHDYLFSETAIARIAKDAPDAQLVVTLREPLERAISAFHYLKLQGRISRRLGLEEALASVPELIDHGRYGSHLEMVTRVASANRLVVLLYDELRNDPQAFLNGLCAAFGIPDQRLSADRRASVNERRSARNPRVVALLRAGGDQLRARGHHAVVARVKERVLASPFLFRPPAGDTDELSPAARRRWRDELRGEVELAESITGLPLRSTWGYDDVGPDEDRERFGP